MFTVDKEKKKNELLIPNTDRRCVLYSVRVITTNKSIDSSRDLATTYTISFIINSDLVLLIGI